MLTLPWHGTELVLNLAPAPPLDLLLPTPNLSSYSLLPHTSHPVLPDWHNFPMEQHSVPSHVLSTLLAMFFLRIFFLENCYFTCQFNNIFPVMISLGMSFSDFGHFLPNAALETFHMSSTFVCALLTLFDNYLLRVHLAHLWFSKEWWRRKYRGAKEVKMRVRRGAEKVGNVAWFVKYTRMRLS